jgi:hypothetical protein
MLSGIRTGKKKKSQKAPPSENAAPVEDELKPKPSSSSASVVVVATNDNLSIADKLRQSLASGNTDILENRTPGKSLDQLERRGRITKDAGGVVGKDDDSAHVVVHLPSSHHIASNKREEDMTVQELAARERGTHMSWDEQMTRNLARLGKKRRRDDKNKDDSDEEVERMKRWLPSDDGAAKKPKAQEKANQREVHRLMDQHQEQEKVTSKCAWWLESSSFSKHRLLALGNHVSLVMAPPNASLGLGNHFYLVPFKHAPSFVDCEDEDVWQEVRRFQTALQNLYARQGKAVIMCETVLPNKGFWQTKLEVIPIPFSVIQDAPLFFKSAMVEQTEEWGTHNKILNTTSQKPLKSVIPKNFPYFYIDWGNISTSKATGYAQIIESSDFRHDFGLDTVAGMMELDPIRFQRKKKFSYEEERQGIADFLAKWEKVDWTKELDNK